MTTRRALLATAAALALVGSACEVAPLADEGAPVPTCEAGTSIEIDTAEATGDSWFHLSAGAGPRIAQRTIELGEPIPAGNWSVAMTASDPSNEQPDTPSEQVTITVAGSTSAPNPDLAPDLSGATEIDMGELFVAGPTSEITFDHVGPNDTSGATDSIYIPSLSFTCADTGVPPVVDPPVTGDPACEDFDFVVESSRQTFEWKGVEREYQLTVPENYDPSTPMPLLLDLHPLVGNIRLQSRVSMHPTEATARGYAVLTPQGTRAGGNGPTFWGLSTAEQDEAPDDFGFLREMILRTERELCVDPDRIYSNGYSNGAGMSGALACGLDDRIAAIGPVAGVPLTRDCPDADPVSVIAFHGTADGTVAYGREGDDPTGVERRMAQFADLGGCDEGPTVTTLADDLEFLEWMNCNEGIDVQLYKVLGGGHNWPGNPIFNGNLGPNTESVNATQAILDFFDAHPRES